MAQTKLNKSLDEMISAELAAQIVSIYRKIGRKKMDRFLDWLISKPGNSVSADEAIEFVELRAGLERLIYTLLNLSGASKTSVTEIVRTKLGSKWLVS